MVAIKWHLKALEDLRNIFDFISRDSLHYAKVTVHRLNDACKQLKKFPKIGRKVPEIDQDEYRELIVQNYRLIYYVDAKEILILAILHSAQEFRI